MADSETLFSMDAWRARLGAIRSASTGLRSFLRSCEALARETGVVRGLSFYWIDGGRPQKILGDRNDKEESLDDVQEQSFEKAVRLSTGERKVFRLPPGFVSGDVPIDQLRDRPWTREDLPLFNGTESTHLFLPLIREGESRACLHAWYREGAGRESIPEMLKMLLDEVARFIGGQSTEAQNALVADYAVQLRLLESVCGEDDPKDFSIFVTNYARRLVGATRVSLFGVRSAADVVSPEAPLRRRAARLRLLGASGLDAVSERSAEAVFLGEVAAAMVSRSLEKQIETAREGRKTPDDSLRTRSILVLAPRDTGNSSDAERDEAIQAYFENEPADWLCALATRTEDGDINGYILCEGKGSLPPMERIREIFSRLDRPLGRAWERLRCWSGTRARIVSRLFGLDGGGGFWRRRAFWLVPLILVALFSWPVSFEVGADATVSSRQFRTLAAPFRANLEEVLVSRGDRVSEGETLGRLRVEEEVLRRAELASRLAVLEMRSRLALQEGREQEAALSRIESEVVRSELALVGNRLERAVFQAPFGGIVVGPENFSEREGTILQEGDPVFELVRADAFTLTLLFREQDFELLQEHAADGVAVDGVFRPSSDPGREIAFRLEDVDQLPAFVDDSVPGRFRVAVSIPVDWNAEGLVDHELSESTGKAEVSLGKRSLFYDTFRDFIHYLRMNLFL